MTAPTCDLIHEGARNVFMHERILAIYDADLSVIGELAYAVGKLTGTGSCALCDITHGLNPFGKRVWRSYCEDRPEVEWLHRNEISDEMLAQLPTPLPCVIKQDAHGYLCTLLDTSALIDRLRGPSRSVRPEARPSPA